MATIWNQSPAVSLPSGPTTTGACSRGFAGEIIANGRTKNDVNVA
jgi:hypothetical protein